MKLWLYDTNEPVYVDSLDSGREICISHFVTSKDLVPRTETLATLWRPEVIFSGDRVDITGLVYDNKGRAYRLESFSLVTRPTQRKGRKA